MIHLVTLNPSLDLHFELDAASRGKVGAVRGQSIHPGGKGLNLARFLSRMMVPFRCWVAGAGRAHPTQRLYRELLRLGEPCLPAGNLPVSAPVRFNLHLSRGGSFEKHNHPGYALTRAELRSLLDFLFRRTRPGDLVVLTGRLPAGAPEDTYREWIMRLQSQGRVIILDTSGEPLRKALDARPFFVKVNLFEMGQALGTSFRNLESFKTRIPSLIRKGIVRGAVTDGARGAIAWDGATVLRLKAPGPVRSPGVVGAGDGFLAGWLAGLSAGLSLSVRARFAAECGARVAKMGIGDFRPPRMNRPRGGS